jgi:uncharacterized glyoxalase superfamily protein PhnB
MAVKAVPDGYHTITPSLVVNDANKLITFMTQAFGAKERMRMPRPDGKVAHAELEIGDSAVMVADASPDFPAQTGSLHFYTDNVDAVYDRALKAGARPQRELANQFYGDRSGMVIDPVGNQWSISQHVEDVSEEELMRRMKEMSPA